MTSAPPRRPGVLEPVPARRSRRARLLAPLVAGLVALAALGLALDSGSSPRSGGSSGRASRGAARVTHKHRSKPAASTHHSPGAPASGETAARSGPATTHPAPVAAAKAPAPDATPAPVPAAAAAPASEAGGPAAAVEAFYGAAARHDYATAWRLADANMRKEVAGYGSFSAQQSAVRSITFHQAATLPGATASQATVAVRTTSVLADRTEQCSGTVRTVRGTAGWLLDGISIDCAP